MTDNKWESFARENPYWYILAPFTGDLDAFWKSGRDQVQAILSEVQDLLKGHDTVIEIGCGVGRCLIPMSSRFRECIGVDVSETMLQLLEKYSQARGEGNKITRFFPHEPWHERKADFVFSVKTLYYIEDFAVIEDCISRVCRSLLGHGVAYLQFDTRPRTMAYGLRNKLPDFLLPKRWRRGIRRIRRDRAVLVRLFETHGLSVLQELNSNTAYHVFILGKAVKS